MNKNLFEGRYFKISFYAFVVISLAILFEKFLGAADIIAINFISGVKFIFSILEPFIFGGFIAYFLDSIVNWIEKKIFVNVNKRHKRLFSAITTYFIFIGLLIWSLIYFIPELIYNVQKLILITPNALGKLNNIRYGFLYEIIDKINKIFGTNYDLSDLFEMILEPFVKSVSSLKNMSGEIITKTFGFASSVLNSVLGLVIAFYMLCDKQRLLNSAKKIVYIIFGNKKSRKIIFSLGEYNSVFKKFIIGKSIDSIIIGVLFFVIASFVNLPYLLFLSLIIGITNMIPYFGPFIGAIPVILIAFLNKPITALWIAIIIFALQQFDGIILGPKILGDSTGLKPLEVIFAIIFGGALFGIFGMFFGVPIFAVILKILRNAVNKKYMEKINYERNKIG